MSKAKLSRFIADRVPDGWMDRLFPQGWVIDNDPHPTDNEYYYSHLTPSTRDNDFLEPNVSS